MAMVYAVCKCANEIETFRYRFLDGKIVLFDRIDTAFTYLNPESRAFQGRKCSYERRYKRICGSFCQDS